MTINQHYVPQLYLRHFSKNKKGLCVYDKLLKKNYYEKIEHIAAFDFLYDINPSNIRNIDNAIFDDTELIEKLNKQVFEVGFSKVENDYAIFLIKFLNKIKSGKTNSIFSTQEIKDFSNYITFQYLRTLDFRDKLLENSDNNLNKDELTTIHLSYMLNEEIIIKYMNNLLNGIWVVGKNNSRQILYTSDTPVIMSEVLFSDNKFVLFPINSEIIILIYPNDFFKDKTSPHNTLEILDKEKVIELNKSIIYGSKRYIFSKTNQSKEISKIIKENHLYL